MSNNNEWELSSGLDLDGATVDITDVEFGFNAKLGAGVLCANFTFVNTESGDEYEQSFSVGKDWDTDRTGKELVSDRPKRINKNTNYGMLIASAVELVDDPSDLGGSPKDATIWVGTRWTMGTVKVLRRNPTTGAETEKDAIVFKEFHGRDLDGAEPEAKPAAKTTAKKATGARKATPKDGPPDDIDAELWDALLTLAREADDHDGFLEAALDIDGVEGNKAAQKAVMGTKAGSVWAAR